MTMQQLLILAGIIVIYVLGRTSIDRIVQKIGRERAISEHRVHYVKSFLAIVWSVLALSFGLVFLGLGFDDLGFFVGSAIAVLGVALFAQWSILSNVTASIFVFFFFPYRVGDDVKILDGENSVEGRIVEITLFHVILSDATGGVLTYPNAMVFQKAVAIRKPGTVAEPPEKEHVDERAD